MEHEVFVPVPAERLREALADPARIARAVPGLQQDVGAEPVTGRLKVRVGSHSVTYRGTVRVLAREDGSYAAEGDATETRGTGSVKLALTISLREADGGSTVSFGGTASADGRVTELPPDAVASAATRLLSRFAEGLGAEAEGEQETPGGPVVTEERETPEQLPEQPEEAPVEPQMPEPQMPEPREQEPEEPQATEAAPAPEPPSAPDAEVPAPAPSEESPQAPQPPAEAAHARRTMIGRSAEEVDHAPPRGRYAPVPAPQTVAPNPALRWAAPAAAVAVASAIVVSRMLRRRR